MRSNKLASFVALCVAAVLCTACSQKTAEAECGQIKKQAMEINSRVPVRIDSITTLVGVSASYVDGICEVFATNSIDEATFFRLSILTNLETNPAQLDLLQINDLVSYFNSEEGQNYSREQLRQSLSENPLIKFDHKNVKMTYTYIFDLGNLKPLKVTIQK